MSGILRSRKKFTICQAIPPFIPCQLAIDILHDHSEVITLNPLVTSFKPIRPPQHAGRNEYFATWYEITERIQFIPGIGQMGSGTINFNGCFHNVPWGLQTHIYAPMNVDLRVQYRVAGDPIGTPCSGPVVRELGLEELGAPSEGLYLRVDIEFCANVTLAGFVRSQLKSAIQEMVERMVRKAERMDAALLQDMISEELRSPVVADPPPEPLFASLNRFSTQSSTKSPYAMGLMPPEMGTRRHSAPDICEMPAATVEMPLSEHCPRPGTLTGPEFPNMRAWSPVLKPQSPIMQARSPSMQSQSSNMPFQLPDMPPVSPLSPLSPQLGMNIPASLRIGRRNSATPSLTSTWSGSVQSPQASDKVWF